MCKQDVCIVQDRTLTGLHRTVRCSTQYLHVYCKYSCTCGCVNVCVHVLSYPWWLLDCPPDLNQCLCEDYCSVQPLRKTKRETLVLNSADSLNRYIKTWKGAWRIEVNILILYNNSHTMVDQALNVTFTDLMSSCFAV